MVEFADAAVGNITAELKARQMYENTLIVFLSDNGGPIRCGTRPTGGPACACVRSCQQWVLARPPACPPACPAWLGLATSLPWRGRRSSGLTTGHHCRASPSSHPSALFAFPVHHCPSTTHHVSANGTAGANNYPLRGGKFPCPLSTVTAQADALHNNAGLVSKGYDACRGSAAMKAACSSSICCAAHPGCRPRRQV